MHRLDHLEVGHVELFVFRRVEVFLGDEKTLCVCVRVIEDMICNGVRRDDGQVSARCSIDMDGQSRTLEEVFVNDAPVLLGNKHAGLNELLRRELTVDMNINTKVHRVGRTTYCETWFALTLGCEDAISARSSVCIPSHPTPENVSVTYRFSRSA